ncbi:MAG: hypothetical protein Q8O67_07225 [Deltaproteobacteria bacterium]|nr:hypothetical protein [Deltaproteobacteria bacterium]
MSDSANSLLPASSASFALTLDQNVSRAVRQRVVALQDKTRRAGTVSWMGIAGTVIGNAVLFTIEPWLVVVGFYAALFAIPIPPVVWWYSRKAALAAGLLNQDKDVAFVGPDGLVFFGDDGFFIEKSGGWKPYGVREPLARRFDTVEYFDHDRTLMVSSASGYSIKIRVPAGWSQLDTKRVQEKVDAFAW